jgi:hypothetical protein
LNLNNRTATFGRFVSTNTTARTLAFGSSGVLNITGSNTTIWNCATVTNWTVTGNAVVNCTYSGATGTRTITAGPLSESNSITFNITAGTDIVAFTGSAQNLNLTGFTGTLSAGTRTIFGNLTLGSGMTVAAGAGTTTLAGTTGTRTIITNGTVFPQSITFNGIGGTWQLQDNLNMNDGSFLTSLVLTNGNVDLNNNIVSTGVFSTDNANPRRIAFGANSVINVAGSSTTLWNASNATNFGYTGNGRVNFTNQIGTPGSRTINHGTLTGGTFLSKAPLMFFATGNLAVSVGGHFTELDFTGFTGTLSTSTRTMYGNIILSPTMSVSSTSLTTTFALPDATQTIVTNGLSVTPFALNVNAANGTFLVTSNMSFGTQVVSLNGGTIDTQGFNITSGAFRSPESNVRTLNAGTSTFTLSGSTSVWNISTSNITVNVANTSIVLNSTAILNVEFFGNSYTYGNLRLEGNPIVANLSTRIFGNNTFTGDFVSNTKTGNYSILFDAGSTNTFESFFVEGQSGNLVTIDTNGAGIHNLVYTGTGNVNVSNCIIADSNASPGNTWYALLTNNNTNGGNNTGWIFGPSVASSSNFFLLF